MIPDDLIPRFVPAKATLNGSQTVKAATECRNGIGTGAEILRPPLEQSLAISFESIRSEAETLLAPGPALLWSQAKVLAEILASLSPIDFHAECDLDDQAKLSQKQLRVVSIREVLNQAREINCGLAKNADFVYVFNGCYWRLIDQNDLEDFLGRAAEKLGVNWITAKDYKFRAELHKQFLSAGYLPSPQRHHSDILINLKNGTFEISAAGRKLREFRRQDFLTYQLPFSCDPGAQAPLWQRFLDDVLPDKGKQTVLAEFFGYIFLKDFKLEKALVLYGSGSNGKSVVFDVISAVLGEANISNYSLEALGQVYFRGHLVNRLLNYCSDISNRLQAATFKLIVSGEPIEARFPYGQPFVMKNYARLAFNANELPSDVSHDEAFFRRFLIIHFDQFIPEDRRDHELAKKIIKSELPGVFNWILAGLDRLIANQRFSETHTVRQALVDYRKESDSTAMFLEDESYVPSDSWIRLKDLYPIYRNYCQENGYRALGNRKFVRRLEANNVLVQKKNVGKVAFLTRHFDEN